MNRPSLHRSRLIRIVLVTLFLFSLVPVIPAGFPGSGLLSLGGEVRAAECVTSCQTYDKLIEAWSNVHDRENAVSAAANASGVPANLIKAIMKLESNGLNLLPNGASAVGPMQVTINNWGWWAQTHGLNLYNADDNIMAGAKILDRFRVQYLEWSHEQGIDPWLTALYAYYAGNPYNLLARDSPAHGGSGITTQQYGARIWASFQFLEQNWPAIAQSKPQEDATLKANAGANPGRAFDGDLSTSWAVTGQSGPPAGAYLQVDLGEPTRVFEISWIFRSTGHADRLRIRVSEDGVNYETIHTTGNAPARQWQYLMIDRSVRSVRFNVDNPNGDATIGYLAEVAVRGVKASEYVSPPPPVVTLDLPGSGGSSGATFTGRIRDGKMNTSWYTNGAPRPASASVYVDLGGEQPVAAIGWVFSQGNGAPVLEIQVSNDRKSWSTIATAGDAPAQEWQWLQTNVTARYVRWLVTNTTGVAQLGYIAEVEIRRGGVPIEQPPPAPADAHHPLTGSGGSSGATFTGRVRDGRLDTDWRTSGAPQPASGFFYIDLGGLMPISAVEWIFSQSGGAPHLEIQVSNDKKSWSSIGVAGNAPAGQWQRLNASASAQYVRWLIVNTSGAAQIGFIAEVRVIAGTPEPEPTPSPTPEPSPTEVPAIDTSHLPATTPIPVVSLVDSAGGTTSGALDGAISTTWQVSSSGWLQADLGAAHDLTHIAWLPVDAACAAGLTLQVSEDGETWLFSAGYPAATAHAWQLVEVAVSGRYVRWSFAGGGEQAGCLAEIAIWGAPAATETPTTEPEPTETATPDVTLEEPTPSPTGEPEIELPVEPTETVVPTETPAEPPVEEPTTEPTPEPEATEPPAQEEP